MKTVSGAPIRRIALTISIAVLSIAPAIGAGADIPGDLSLHGARLVRESYRRLRSSFQTRREPQRDSAARLQQHRRSVSRRWCSSGCRRQSLWHDERRRRSELPNIRRLRGRVRNYTVNI